MLFFVGLGLGDAKDITVRGLETVKACQHVFLEAYTSVLTCGREELQAFHGKDIRLADRDMVEQGADEILTLAVEEDVAFLVVGDPFGATTHSDLMLRARQKGVKTKAIHNASIMNAIGCVGLQLYNFGETVSIPFWSDDWRPESFFDKVEANMKAGRHTLCLLDIKVKERTVENMMKGRDVFEPPRFMTCSQAAQQLVEIARSRGQNETLLLKDTSVCVAAARVGADDQELVTLTLKELADGVDMGKPLHSLVIPGEMHYLEEEAIKVHTSSN